MPRLFTESLGGGDMSWLASTHGIENARTATLDVSTFTEATHYPDGYFPSGLPVNVADEGAVTPWTGVTDEELGFVLRDVRVNVTDVTIDVTAAVLRHGLILSANLPVALASGVGSTAGFTIIAGGA